MHRKYGSSIIVLVALCYPGLILAQEPIVMTTMINPPGFGHKLYGWSIECSSATDCELGSPHELADLERWITGTAIDGVGNLLLLDSDADSLLRFDPDAGNLDHLVDLDIDVHFQDDNAIAVGPASTVWLVSQSTLYTIDLETGVTTLIGDTGLSLDVVTMTFHRGQLYAGTGTQFVELNISTGIATVINEWSSSYLSACCSDGENLWAIMTGFTGPQPGGSVPAKFATFDPASGDFTGNAFDLVGDPIEAVGLFVFQSQGVPIPATSGPTALLMAILIALGGVVAIRAGLRWT